MFTGIVQGIGEIVSVAPTTCSWAADGDQQGLRLTIAFGSLEAGDVAIGDSIAVNGACMTVVSRTNEVFEVDVSMESLSKTTRLDQPGAVNLEKAMRASDRLGGHLVSGHVDGRATLLSVTSAGESWQFRVGIDRAFAPYVSHKGSITLDGVSLTVNALTDTADGTEIMLNLIPHTWMATTLHERTAGDFLNLEVDQLAKQVARILERLHQT
jgi:riboflavin synthase